LISVVVYAQRPDRPAQIVADILAQFGRTELHLSSSITAEGKGETLYIVNAVNRLENLKLPQTVILFADRSAPRQLKLCDNAIVVAGADNRRVSNLLCGRPNPLITCGTGLRDTLTLSSSVEDRVVLCAQREIPTAAGKWIEPFELAVQLGGASVRTTLFAAGTAAACGCDLSGREFTIGKKDL